MKVVITGHTSGIGLALTRKFPNYIGLSRSNNCNINDNEIISKIKDADVFINNAYDKFKQIDLLYNVWEIWKDTKKIICCISSNSPDGYKQHPHPYAVHKEGLDFACMQLNNLGKPCRIINVRPGYVDTPRVKNVQYPKINPDELAEQIKNLIYLNNSYWVSSITIVPS